MASLLDTRNLSRESDFGREGVDYEIENLGAGGEHNCVLWQYIDSAQ